MDDGPSNIYFISLLLESSIRIIRKPTVTSCTLTKICKHNPITSNFICLLRSKTQKARQQSKPFIPQYWKNRRNVIHEFNLNKNNLNKCRGLIWT